jgi:hypothetical protein
MEGVGRFYGHLICFTAVCYILWPLGIFCGNLVEFMVIWLHFFPFWYVAPVKIWQPWRALCPPVQVKQLTVVRALSLSLLCSVTKCGQSSPFGRYFFPLGAFFLKKYRPMIWPQFFSPKNRPRFT